MFKILRIFTIGLFALIFMSLSVYADNPQTAMSSFYNDLAGIVENNMNYPDKCVSKIKSLIESNAALIEQAQKKAEEQRKKMQNMDYSSMTQEKIQEMMSQVPMEQMEQMMKSVNKWAENFMVFAEKYPEHANKIEEIMKKFMPQNAE